MEKKTTIKKSFSENKKEFQKYVFTTDMDQKLNQRMLPLDHPNVEQSSVEVNSTSSNKTLLNSSETNIVDLTNSHKKSLANLHPSKKHGIGITGFDRVTNPFYNFKTKTLWISCLAIHIVISVYLIWQCFHEFLLGKPAISIKLSMKEEIPLPTVLFCPIEFYGNNRETELMQNLYRETFKNTMHKKDQIYFSDLLRLPNMTVQKLWRLQKINFNSEIKCSVSKTDRSCEADFKLRLLNTVAGECLVMTYPGIKFFGPTTSIDLFLYFPKNNRASYSKFDFYLRCYSVSQANYLYAALDVGIPSPLSIHAKVVAEGIEVINLNATNFPCEDGHLVEKCVDECIEEKLFGKVKCRLPFMENSSLPYCKDPESFNVSFEGMKYVMNQIPNCRRQCPRKCYEILMILNTQIMSFPKPNTFMTFQIFDRLFLSIQEYYWYTFFNLLADIGGILGFFLDSSFLTFLEICEFGFTRFLNVLNGSYKNKSKDSQGFYYARRNRSQKRNFPNSKEEYRQEINIGIVGFDRLLSKNKGIFLKTMWLLVIVTATAMCSIQIFNAVLDFKNGDPDATLIFETNDSVKLPTITFCPYRAFDFWDVFLGWKEAWKNEYNVSGSVSLSDLAMFERADVMDFWNSYGVHSNQFTFRGLKCSQISGLPSPNENVSVDYRPIKTIYGSCVSIIVETLIAFRGEATFMCFTVKGLPDSNTKDIFMFTVHNKEDDPRTLDPNLWKLIGKGSVGITSIHARKREYLNRKALKCQTEEEVGKCRSNCYDSLMEEKSPCRLPFMKNNSMQICNSSEAFNATMEIGYSLLQNYSENKWCNCPRKCKEYVYGINSNDLRVRYQILVFIVQFPNNIFKFTKEYQRMSASNLFNNICGSLGLFLGFSLLTVFEIIEALILMFHRLLNQKT